MDANYVKLIFLVEVRNGYKQKKENVTWIKLIQGCRLPQLWLSINFSTGYREITSKLYKFVFFLLFTKNRYKHDFKEQ